VEQLPLGDHVAFLLEPQAGQAPEQIGTLVTFGDVQNLNPGHPA